MPDTMKAIVFKQYGNPEVLQVAQIPKPKPKSNEVLVRIRATSVTSEDPKMRGFHHPLFLKIPIGLLFGFTKPKKNVLGMEFSGEIEAIGNRVKSYIVGQSVFGYTGLNFGAYAAYKNISEKSIMTHKPINLSFEESACMVNGALSALVYLKKKGKVRQGDKVLIYGASGSVGTAAVQLAKHFGAQVTAVCSTKNIDVVRKIGADFIIDYKKQDIYKNDEKYNLVFDTVGKTSMKKSLKLLEPKGKYLRTEFGITHMLYGLYSHLFKKRKVVVASSNFYWKKEDLDFLKSLAEKELFRPVIDKNFTLEEIVEAHKYVELGRKVGNVAISVR